MKALRTLVRSARDADSESGLGLIEVLVAMMIFAIISVGVAYTLLSSFSLTNDSRSRAVASNLAAQEIDLDRSAADIFALQSTTTDKVVQVPASTGISYSISRTVNWVYASGGDVDCSASATSSLLYKRIHIEVSWPKMVGQPVIADTVFAPSSKVSVDTLGTILVSTKSSSGAPVQGSAVSVSPNPGSTAAATDATGCSYVLKVPPGTYTVSVSKAGYLDPTQSAAPTKTLTVTAGTSSSAGFTIDNQGTVSIGYAKNFPLSLSPALPSNMPVTFSSNYGVYQTPANRPSSVKLFPAPEYSVVAGGYVAKTDTIAGCLSPDPGQWLPGTDGLGHAIQSGDPVTVSFAPGNPDSASLPMGQVTVKNTAGFSGSGMAYISATSVTPIAGLGDPGCTGTFAMKYTFGAIMNKSKNSVVTIALPYGTWALTMDGSSTPTTAVAKAQLSAPAGVTGTSISATGVVTLDPRVVVP